MNAVKQHIIIIVACLLGLSAQAKEHELEFGYFHNNEEAYTMTSMEDMNTFSVSPRISDNENLFYSPFRKKYTLGTMNNIRFFQEFPNMPGGPLGMIITLLIVGIGFILVLYVLFEIYLFLSFLFGGR